MSLTKNPNVLKWVDEMVALCKPDKVVWIDGSKEQIDSLIEEVTSLPDDSWDKMYKLTPRSTPTASTTEHAPTTLHVLRTEHSSARRRRRAQVLQTTGWLPMR